MALSTVRTLPAGTFPLVSANVSSRMVVSNYHEHISSSPRGLATGVDVESLELSWNTSKPTPCLLVRLTYQATSHHAAAAACVLNKRPCASRRDTPHERARARDEHHSPAMPTAHAFYTRNGARDLEERAGFRVLGRCRRRVVGGRRSCVWVFYRRAKRRQAPWWEIKTPGTRALFLCSVRDLPWADPLLPGTKRPKGRAGDHRKGEHFPDLGLL